MTRAQDQTGRRRRDGKGKKEDKKRSEGSTRTHSIKVKSVVVGSMARFLAKRLDRAWADESPGRGNGIVLYARVSNYEGMSNLSRGSFLLSPGMKESAGWPMGAARRPLEAP